MAEGKKSFIAYSDWDGMFQALPNEVAGKLIKHIFSYVNDRNPESDDFIINALFEQVKSTLKRDLKKWEEQREQRSIAGKKSAEIRSTKTNDRSTLVNETERNSTVSVSVNDNVNDNDSVNNTTKRTSITIGQEIFLGKTSEWLMKHKEAAIETFLMSNRKFTRDEIFKKLDEETNLYHFKDTNHPYNYFKSVYGRMEKPQQKQEPVRNIKVLS